MLQTLEGKRIVIAGSRKIDEMSALIEKRGGTTIVRSLQGTVFLAERELESDLRRFTDHGADWTVFTTGIGLETLLLQAEKIGIHDVFVDNIRRTRVAAGDTRHWLRSRSSAFRRKRWMTTERPRLNQRSHPL
jgi:uroporphyrinogen-III synthase